MDNSKKLYSIGITLIILGLVFLTVNAVDYFLNLSAVPKCFVVPSGIVMCVLGFYITGKSKEKE